MSKKKNDQITSCKHVLPFIKKEGWAKDKVQHSHHVGSQKLLPGLET